MILLFFFFLFFFFFWKKCSFFFLLAFTQSSEEDVSNFDARFTNMAITDSPADNVKVGDDPFKGFSYVAPYLTQFGTSASPKSGLSMAAAFRATSQLS